MYPPCVGADAGQFGAGEFGSCERGGEGPVYRDGGDGFAGGAWDVSGGRSRFDR